MVINAREHAEMQWIVERIIALSCAAEPTLSKQEVIWKLEATNPPDRIAYVLATVK